MLRNRRRYCTEGLAAVGCLDPGRKSSGINLGLVLTVSDNADIGAYITVTLWPERIDHVVQSIVARGFGQSIGAGKHCLPLLPTMSGR